MPPSPVPVPPKAYGAPLLPLQVEQMHSWLGRLFSWAHDEHADSELSTAQAVQPLLSNMLVISSVSFRTLSGVFNDVQLVQVANCLYIVSDKLLAGCLEHTSPKDIVGDIATPYNDIYHNTLVLSLAALHMLFSKMGSSSITNIDGAKSNLAILNRDALFRLGDPGGLYSDSFRMLFQNMEDTEEDLYTPVLHTRYRVKSNENSNDQQEVKFLYPSGERIKEFIEGLRKITPLLLAVLSKISELQLSLKEEHDIAPFVNIAVDLIMIMYTNDEMNFIDIRGENEGEIVNRIQSIFPHLYKIASSYPKITTNIEMLGLEQEVSMSEKKKEKQDNRMYIYSATRFLFAQNLIQNLTYEKKNLFNFLSEEQLLSVNYVQPLIDFILKSPSYGGNKQGPMEYVSNSLVLNNVLSVIKVTSFIGTYSRNSTDNVKAHFSIDNLFLNNREELANSLYNSIRKDIHYLRKNKNNNNEENDDDDDDDDTIVVGESEGDIKDIKELINGISEFCKVETLRRFNDVSGTGQDANNYKLAYLFSLQEIFDNILILLFKDKKLPVFKYKITDNIYAQIIDSIEINGLQKETKKLFLEKYIKQNTLTKILISDGNRMFYKHVFRYLQLLIKLTKITCPELLSEINNNLSEFFTRFDFNITVDGMLNADRKSILMKCEQLIEFGLMMCDEEEGLVSSELFTEDKVKCYINLFNIIKQLSMDLIDESHYMLLTEMCKLLLRLLNDNSLKNMIIRQLLHSRSFSTLIDEFFSLYLTSNPLIGNDQLAIFCRTALKLYSKALRIAASTYYSIKSESKQEREKEEKEEEEKEEIKIVSEEIDVILGKLRNLLENTISIKDYLHYVGYIVPGIPELSKKILESDILDKFFAFCNTSETINDPERKKVIENVFNDISLLILSLLSNISLTNAQFNKEEDDDLVSFQEYDYMLVRNNFDLLVRERLITYTNEHYIENGIMNEIAIKFLITLSAPRFANEKVPSILLPEVIEILMSHTFTLNKKIEEAKQKGKITDIICRKIDRQQKCDWLEDFLEYITKNQYSAMVLARSKVPDIILNSLKPALYNSSIFVNSSLIAISLLKNLIPYVSQSFLNSIKIIIADPLVYESLDFFNNINNVEQNNCNVSPKKVSLVSTYAMQQLPAPLKLVDESFSLLGESISPIKLMPYSTSQFVTNGLLTKCDFRNDQSISFAGWFSVSLGNELLNINNSESLLKRVRLVHFQAVNKDIGFSVYYTLTQKQEEFIEVEGNNFSSVSAPIIRINQTGININPSLEQNSLNSNRDPSFNKYNSISTLKNQFFHIAINISHRILDKPTNYCDIKELSRTRGLEIFINGHRTSYVETISSELHKFKYSKFEQLCLASFPKELESNGKESLYQKIRKISLTNKEGSPSLSPSMLSSQSASKSTSSSPSHVSSYMVLYGNLKGDRTINKASNIINDANISISIGTTLIMAGKLKPLNAFALSSLGITEKVPLYSSFSGISEDDKFPVIYTRWGDALPSRDEAISKKIIVDRICDILKLDTNMIYKKDSTQTEILENPLFAPIRDIMPSGINMNILLETRTFSNDKDISNYLNSTHSDNTQKQINNAFPYEVNINESTGSTLPLVFGIQSMNKSAISPPLGSRTGYDNILYAIMYGLVDLESCIELDSAIEFVANDYDVKFMKKSDSNTETVLLNSNSLCKKKKVKLYRCIETNVPCIVKNYPRPVIPEFGDFLEIIKILNVVISNLDKKNSSWLSPMIHTCLLPLTIQTTKISIPYQKCDEYVMNILISLYKYMVKNDIITLPLDVLNQLYYLVFPLDNMELLSCKGFSPNGNGWLGNYASYLQHETISYRYFNLVFNRFFLALRFGDRDCIKEFKKNDIIDAVSLITNTISKINTPKKAQDDIFPTNSSNIEVQMCPILYGLTILNLLLSEQPFLINVPTAGIISVMRRDGTLPILLGLLDDLVNEPLEQSPLKNNDTIKGTKCKYSIKPLDIPIFHLEPISELVISIILQLEMADLRRSEINMMIDIIRHIMGEFKTDYNYNFHEIVLPEIERNTEITKYASRKLIFKPLPLIPSISLAIALMIFFNILIDVYIDLMQLVNSKNDEMKEIIQKYENKILNPYDLAATNRIDPKYPDIIKHFMSLFIQNIQTNDKYLNSFKTISKNIIIAKEEEITNKEKKINFKKIINKITSTIVSTEKFNTFTDNCYELFYQIIPDIVHFTFKIKSLIGKTKYDENVKYKLRSVDMLFDFGHRLHLIGNLLHIREHAGLQFNFGKYIDNLHSTYSLHSSSGSNIGLISTYMDIQYISRKILLDVNSILNWYELFNSEYLDSIIGVSASQQQTADDSSAEINNNNNNNNNNRNQNTDEDIDTKINKIIVGGGLGRVPDLSTITDSISVNLLLENFIFQTKYVYKLIKTMESLTSEEQESRLKNQYFIYPFVAILIIIDYFNLKKSKKPTSQVSQRLNANQQNSGSGKLINMRTKESTHIGKNEIGALEYCLADTTLAKPYCIQDTVNMSISDNRYNNTKAIKYVDTKLESYNDGRKIKSYDTGLLCALAQASLILGGISSELEMLEQKGCCNVPAFFSGLTIHLSINVHKCLLSNIDYVIDTYLVRTIRRTISSQTDKTLANTALNSLKGMLYQIYIFKIPVQNKLKLLTSILHMITEFYTLRADYEKCEQFCDFFNCVVKTITNIFGDTQFTNTTTAATATSSSSSYNINAQQNSNVTSPIQNSTLSNNHLGENNLTNISSDLNVNIFNNTIDCLEDIGNVLITLNEFLSFSKAKDIKQENLVLIMLCTLRISLIYTKANRVQVMLSKKPAEGHLTKPGIALGSDASINERNEYEMNQSELLEDVNSSNEDTSEENEPVLTKNLVELLGNINPALIIPDYDILKNAEAKKFNNECVKNTLINTFKIDKQMEKKANSLSSTEKLLVPYIAHILIQLFSKDITVDIVSCYVFAIILKFEPNILVNILFNSTNSLANRNMAYVEKLIVKICDVLKKIFRREPEPGESLKKELENIIDFDTIDILRVMSNSYPLENVYNAQRDKFKNNNKVLLSSEQMIKDKKKRIEKFERNNKVKLIYLNAISRSSKLRGRCISYIFSLRSEDVLKSYNISSAKWMKEISDNFKFTEECIAGSENLTRISDLNVYKRSAFKADSLTYPFLIENNEFFRNFRGKEKFDSSYNKNRLIDFSKYLSKSEKSMVVYRTENEEEQETGDINENNIDIEQANENVDCRDTYGFLIDCNDFSTIQFYDQFVKRLTYIYIEDALQIVPYITKKTMVKDLTPPGMLPYMAMNVDLSVGRSAKQPGLCLVSNDEVTFASHVNVIPVDIKDGIERILSEKYSTRKNEITVVFDRPYKGISHLTSEDISSVLGILGAAVTISTSQIIGGKSTDNSVTKFGEIQSPTLGMLKSHGSDWVYSVIPPDWPIIARAKEIAFGAYNTSETNMPSNAKHRYYSVKGGLYNDISFSPDKQHLDYLFNNKIDTLLPQCSIHNNSQSNSVVILGSKDHILNSSSNNNNNNNNNGNNNININNNNNNQKGINLNSPSNIEKDGDKLMTLSSLNSLDDQIPITTDGSLIFYPFNVPDISFQHVYAPFVIENVFGTRSRNIYQNSIQDSSSNNETNTDTYSDDNKEENEGEQSNINYSDKRSLINALNDLNVSIIVGEQQAKYIKINDDIKSTVFELDTAFNGINMFLNNLRITYGDIKVSHISSDTIVNLRRINMQHRPTGIKLGLSTPHSFAIFKVDETQCMPEDEEDKIYRRLSFDAEACNIYKINGASDVLLSTPDKYNSHNALFYSYIRHCIESIASGGLGKNKSRSFTYRSSYYEIPGYVSRELLYAFLTKTALMVKSSLINNTINRPKNELTTFDMDIINPLSQEGQETSEINTLLNIDVSNIEYTTNIVLLKSIIEKSDFKVVGMNFTSTIPSDITARYILSNQYFGAPNLLPFLLTDTRFLDKYIYPIKDETVPFKNRIYKPIRLINNGTFNGKYNTKAYVDSWKGDVSKKENNSEEVELTTAISLQRLWACGLITTFEFINYLNELAGRYSALDGFGDPAASTIFPWILNDFRVSSILDIIKHIRSKDSSIKNRETETETESNLSLKDTPLLNNYVKFMRRKYRPEPSSQGDILYISEESEYKSIFRDLEYPIGAQTEKERNNLAVKFDFSHEQYIRSLKNKNKKRIQFPPFHFGTLFSTASSNQLYLFSLSPNIENHLSLQSFKYDYPSRQYTNIMKYVRSNDTNNPDGLEVPTVNPMDNLEQIAEIYYYNYLNKNPYNNGVIYGRKQWVEKDEKQEDGSILRTANGLFAILPYILESVYVKKHLMDWIDLIFGRNSNTCVFSSDPKEEAEKNRSIAKINTFYSYAYSVPNIETYYESTFITNGSDPKSTIQLQSNEIKEKYGVMEQREFFGSVPKQLFKFNNYEYLYNCDKNNIKIDIMKAISLSENISCKNVKFNKEAIIGDKPVRAVYLDVRMKHSQIQEVYSRVSKGDLRSPYEVMNVMSDIVTSDCDIFVDNSTPYSSSGSSSSQTLIIPCSDYMLAFEALGDGYVQISRVEQRILGQRMAFQEGDQDYVNDNSMIRNSYYNASNTYSMSGMSEVMNGSIIIDNSNLFGMSMSQVSTTTVKKIGVFYLGCYENYYGGSIQPLSITQIGGNVIVVNCSDGSIKFFSIRTNKDIDISNKKSIGMHETNVMNDKNGIISKPKATINQTSLFMKNNMEKKSFSNTFSNLGISSLETISKKFNMSSNKRPQVNLLGLEIPLSPMEIMTKTATTKTYFNSLNNTVSQLCSEILPLEELRINNMAITSNYINNMNNNNNDINNELDDALFIKEIACIPSRVSPLGKTIPLCIDYNNNIDMTVVAYDDGTLMYLINSNIFKMTNIFYLLKYNEIDIEAISFNNDNNNNNNNSQEHMCRNKINVIKVSLFDNGKLLIILSDETSDLLKILLISPSNIIEAMWNLDICGEEGLLRKNVDENLGNYIAQVRDIVVLKEKNYNETITCAFNISIKDGTSSGIAFVGLEVINLDSCYSAAPGTFSDVKLKRFISLEEQYKFGTITTMNYNSMAPWIFLVGTSSGSVLGITLPMPEHYESGNDACGICGCKGFDVTCQVPYDNEKVLGYNENKGKPLLRSVAPHRGIYNGILMCEQCLQNMERERLGLQALTLADNEENSNECGDLSQLDLTEYSNENETEINNNQNRINILEDEEEEVANEDENRPAVQTITSIEFIENNIQQEDCEEVEEQPDTGNNNDIQE